MSTEGRDVPVLRPLTDRAVGAFTTRIGGVSTGPFAELNVTFAVDDDGDRVRANRDIAGRAIGRDSRWSVVKQVHGGDVIRAVAQGHRRPADAHWTDDPSRTIAVLSADCVLGLLAADRLGVVHAGWRGLVAGVVENAIEATAASDAFFGPAIGPCCFEVGPEVITAFSERFGPDAIADSRHVDLWAAAALAARRAGAVTVHAARLCTSCHPDLFFSHRRDRGRTGRQALIARLPDRAHG